MKNFFTLILALFFLIPILSAQNSNLVWFEDFNYTGLPDSSDWYYDVGGHGWGNNELQYYTQGRLENTRVENGTLIIEARKENYEENTYTSGRLISKGTWLYGRFEVRAKLPSAVGTWPAIWMLPTDWAYGGWPGSGEIDIMEHVGYDFGNVHGSTHSENYNFKTGGNPTGHITNYDVADNFHTYACEWHPDRIDFFFDDVLYFTSYNDNTGWQSWPFDKDFHFILNIAVGGDWGGVMGVDHNAFPQQMVIDYIKVYDFGYAANDTEAPNVASNLIADANETYATLSWNHTTDNVGVEDYIVFLNGVAVDTTSSASISVNGLTEATTYNFAVQTRDVAGNLSPTSSAVEFTTKTIIPQSIPAQIEAESFIAFSGVQAEECTDLIEGDKNVGWIDAGDWMKYSISVQTDDVFSIDLRVASDASSSGELQIVDETGSVLATKTIEPTGGWQTWNTITIDGINLNAGEHVLTLVAQTGGFNINWIKFNGTVPVKLIIEAEDYKSMYGIQTEDCIEGTLNVGWIDAGDWMSYEVEVVKSGMYTVEYRVASEPGNGLLTLGLDGTDLSSISIAATGGWQNWTTISETVYLSEGINTYTLFASQGGFNINWFSVEFTSSEDNQAPSAVTGISTQASTSSIDASWDVANDNVGVIAYDIYLDNSLVTTTENTFYLFTGLSSSTNYTIGIIAKDAAGNESQISEILCQTEAEITVIEAESYSNMWGIEVETCTEGGLNVGWIDTGDWMSYDIYVPVSGTYRIDYRVASAVGGGNLILSQNSTDLATNSISNTGGWQNWVTITNDVYLNAGNQQLALYAANGGFNVNWWSFSFNGIKSVENTKENEKPQVKELVDVITVYPNPVSETLNVRTYMDNYTLEIYSLSGQRVFVESNLNQSIKKDLSGLTKGVYILKLKNKKQNFMQKLIIK